MEATAKKWVSPYGETRIYVRGLAFTRFEDKVFITEGRYGMQIQISTLSSYKNEIEDELLKFVDGRDFQTILSSI